MSRTFLYVQSIVFVLAKKRAKNRVHELASFVVFFSWNAYLCGHLQVQAHDSPPPVLLRVVLVVLAAVVVRPAVSSSSSTIVVSVDRRLGVSDCCEHPYR